MNQYHYSYALALYHIFKASKQLAQNKQIAKKLLNIFFNYPELITLLNAYELSLSQKFAIIDQLLQFKDFKGHNLQKWSNFCKLLTEKHHWRFAKIILKDLLKMINQDLKIKSGIVFCSIPLKPSQISALNKQMQLYFQMPIELEVKIDHNLIGGIKIMIDNQEFNGSIDAQLNILKTRLLNQDLNQKIIKSDQSLESEN